jgi:magnesium transporter
MSMQTFAYRKGEVEVIGLENFDRYQGYNKWISLLHPDTEELDQIFSRFALHPLIIEDITNPREIPKVDEYAPYTFIVTDIPVVEDGDVTIDKLNIVLGKDFVISVSDNWDTIRAVETALVNKTGNVTDFGPDFLAYFLLDQATDRYYPALDDLEDTIAELEDTAMTSPGKQLLPRMAGVRVSWSE